VDTNLEQFQVIDLVKVQRAVWAFEHNTDINEPTYGGAYEDKTIDVSDYLYGVGKHRYHTVVGLNWDQKREDEEPSWWKRMAHGGRHKIGVARGARGQSTRRERWFKKSFLAECIRMQYGTGVSGHIGGVMVGLASAAVWFFAL
jgi:hypothetical protein